MKWLNYHHLIYFKEIASRGSISKASKALNVGQPALSSQLKNLEESLDIKLFERKGRRLHLTEPGRIALDYAKRIDVLGQELMEVLQNKAFTEEIHLTVGTLDCIPKYLISDILDFAHKKTGCFLSVFESSLDGLLRQLLTHQIELIVSDHPLAGLKHKKLYSKKIVTRPIMAYASPKFKHLRSKFPYSLDGVSCIVPTKHSKLRQEVEDFFHIRNIEPRFIGEAQDPFLQKILAAKGEGVVFLPVFTIKEFSQNKQLIRIGKLDQVFSEYYLVYSEKIVENPAVKLVVQQDFDRMRL